MTSLPLTNLHGAFDAMPNPQPVAASTVQVQSSPLLLKILNSINISNLKLASRFLLLVLVFFLIIRFLYESTASQSTAHPASSSTSNLAANVQLLNLIRDARIIPIQDFNKTARNKSKEETWPPTQGSTLIPAPHPPPPPPPALQIIAHSRLN